MKENSKWFWIEREWCSREKGKLCCFHIHFFYCHLFGRKDGHWYVAIGLNTLWIFPFKWN